MEYQAERLKYSLKLISITSPLPEPQGLRATRRDAWKCSFIWKCIYTVTWRLTTKPYICGCIKNKYLALSLFLISRQDVLINTNKKKRQLLLLSTIQGSFLVLHFPKSSAAERG